MGEHPIILSGNRDTDDEDIEDKNKKNNNNNNNKIISKSSNSNKRECWSSCEKLVRRQDSPAERSSTRRHPSLVLSLSLGYGNKRGRVSISSLLAGFLLVSLLVLSHFRATLAVPTRMEQQQQQDRHQNHHHHQYHHQAESLEAHESTDEGTRDNTEFRDDDDDELETLRRSIVEGLGLKRIPDPSKANVSQTEYERAHGEYLSRLQMSRAPGDRRRKRLHTFHATEVPSRVKRQAVDHHLFFPVEMPVDTVVDHANLRLLLATDLEENPVDVSIYRLTNSSRHLVRRERIKRLSGARWIELDTTETATYWHEGLDDNLGLELRLENTRGGNVLFSDPVFNVFTTSGRGYSRRRRSAPEQLMSLHKGRRTECRGDNKKCCRHEMTVIFKDIKGFEFIVQPKNFDAGYCKGRCPPRYNPAHHHALLQSLIWKEDKRKAPRPCCAPSKLAELEILYFDENDPTKLKVSSWKNMRVLECACS